MKLIKTLLLVLIILPFISCQKQPTANFSTDNSEYAAGDVIKLVNTSTDANNYIWTMPNGQLLTNKNINYTTSDTQSGGEITFKLQALSRNKKKADEISKSFAVIAATGQLTIWTSNTSQDQIMVSIDGVASGTISQHYSSTPACAAAGCVTVTLKVGSHTLSATDGTYSWNGSMTVNKNACSTIELK